MEKKDREITQILQLRECTIDTQIRSLQPSSHCLVQKTGKYTHTCIKDTETNAQKNHIYGHRHKYIHIFTCVLLDILFYNFLKTERLVSTFPGCPPVALLLAVGSINRQLVIRTVPLPRTFGLLSFFPTNVSRAGSCIPAHP